MPTSRVKTNLFLMFEIAAKWQNVLHMTILHADSLNQPINVVLIQQLCGTYKLPVILIVLKYTGSVIGAWFNSNINHNTWIMVYFSHRLPSQKFTYNYSSLYQLSSIRFACSLMNYALLTVTKLPNNELTGIHTLSLPPLLL